MVWSLFFITMSIYFSYQARGVCHIAAEVRSSYMGQIVDIIGNIMSVRLFAQKKAEAHHFSTIMDKAVKADQAREWYFFKVYTVQGTSFLLYQSFSLYTLVQGFKNGSITAGDFALVLTLNLSMITHLWELFKEVGKFTLILGDLTQGLKIILSPIDVKDKEGAKALNLSKGDIVFKNVYFHYAPQNPLFNDLSVTIKAGEKVGLVGYSGGGKTTFINLILRLYDTQKGEILIDGQNIADVTQDSLHRSIGLIPQDPALFHRSLFDNIHYGDKTSTEADVIKAAQKAHAHDFIIHLPQKYHSLVGERGVKLSGGQRQRIAIARAFLKDAPILILDEATSQLDSVTESVIQESLLDLMNKKTTLVIAHRLSTLLHMDRILVFDKGRIVEDGTHHELLNQGGLYKTLWEAQIGGFLGDGAANILQKEMD